MTFVYRPLVPAVGRLSAAVVAVRSIGPRRGCSPAAVYNQKTGKAQEGEAFACSAFRRDRVDGWAIWDPFYAETELAEPVRVLLTGDRVSPSNAFFLAQREYASKRPDIITVAISDLEHASRWSQQHQQEVAGLISRLTACLSGRGVHRRPHRLWRRFLDG